MRTKSVQECLDRPVETMLLDVPSATSSGTYTVIVTDEEEPQEWICECEGWRFRGYCSHQDRGWDAFCRWNSITGPEVQTAKEKRAKICPRCGGDTSRTWRRT